ncbi:MAG: hypothetical protein IJF33_00115 [Clostridia bacterium]|nr:hypothetical protein [Clostridia bacterium]
MNLILAEIAAEEAKKNYHGDTEAAIGNLQPIAELFEMEEDVSLESLNGDWSGAFVYYCVALAEGALPIRYPDTRVHASFAKVEAWEEYARLPKIHLWRPFVEAVEIGDIVVFETAEAKPTQMGVVLAVNGDCMDVAVGNHRNHSAIVERSTTEGVRGWIRLED